MNRVKYLELLVKLNLITLFNKIQSESYLTQT